MPEVLTHQPRPVQQSEHNSSEQSSESIFNYYSVENEINFLREIDHLSEAEKRFYLRENVKRFLGEFAGRVPYTKISYLLTSDGLEFGGMPVSGTYRQTALLAGPNSREADEWVGFDRVQQKLLAGSTSETEISPPKIADYGFAMHFQRDSSGRVDEYILRYPEKMGDISMSKRILHSINPNLDYQTTGNFIRNPVSTHSDNPRYALNRVLAVIGIADDEIQKSTRFEQAVNEKLSLWVDDYVDCVANGDVLNAELLLTAIFNRARAIKKSLEFSLDYKELIDTRDERELFVDFASQSAKVVGGGNCPVTKVAHGFFSGSDILSQIKSGRTVEELLLKSSDYKNDPNLCQCGKPDAAHFHCDGNKVDEKSGQKEQCGHPIIVGEGTSTCASCGAGAICN